jgi:hypothetical protein
MAAAGGVVWAVPAAGAGGCPGAPGGRPGPEGGGAVGAFKVGLVPDFSFNSGKGCPPVPGNGSRGVRVGGRPGAPAAPGGGSSALCAIVGGRAGPTVAGWAEVLGWAEVPAGAESRGPVDTWPL